MKITILAVGKLKEKYWKQAIAEYEKRLGPYTKIDIIEVPDEKAPENMSDKEIEQVKEKRPTNTSQNQTTINSHYIRNTRKDAIFRRIGQELNQRMTQGQSDFVFVIGGSNGLHKDVLQRSNYALSFSKMTFPSNDAGCVN